GLGGAHEPAYADLGELLQAPYSSGQCVISVAASQPNERLPAALLRLDLTSDDGRSQTFFTDEQWTASERPQTGWQNAGFTATDWHPAEVVAAIGEGPFNLSEDQLLKSADRQPKATPIDQLVIAKDFKVELLYSVPKA